MPVHVAVRRSGALKSRIIYRVWETGSQQGRAVVLPLGSEVVGVLCGLLAILFNRLVPRPETVPFPRVRTKRLDDHAVVAGETYVVDAAGWHHIHGVLLYNAPCCAAAALHRSDALQNVTQTFTGIC